MHNENLGQVPLDLSLDLDCWRQKHCFLVSYLFFKATDRLGKEDNRLLLTLGNVSLHLLTGLSATCDHSALIKISGSPVSNILRRVMPEYSCKCFVNRGLESLNFRRPPL